jgi:hypothetical protein
MFCLQRLRRQAGNDAENFIQKSEEDIDGLINSSPNLNILGTQFTQLIKNSAGNKAIFYIRKAFETYDGGS